MLRALTRTLREAGQDVLEYPSADGSMCLVLPHGGRVLGLRGPRSDENFFWTNPALETVAAARAFFASDGWHNSGGDRTWLAPEVDFFLPEFPRRDKYVQPRELDAGMYAVEAAGGRLVLSTVVRVTLSRPRRPVAAEVRKELGPAPDPLRWLPVRGSPDDLEYAGYTLRTTARFLAEPPPGDAWMGVWSLLQLPHRGDMVIATHGRTEPRVYFGSVNRDDLIVSDREVVWRMRASGEHKIGVVATAATGRVGYLLRGAERWSLVIRNFPVNPSGEYVDVPASDTEALGYAFQACNIDSALGAFSEMEHHAPAARGSDASEDVSQVWAYRGSPEAVRQVAAHLLGSSLG